MESTLRTAAAAGLVLAACLTGGVTGAAEPLRFKDSRVELTVSAVSNRTVQVVVAPLDEKETARPGPPSTVLVGERPRVALRRRELAGAEEVSAGKLRVRVKPGPLTVSLKGPSGKVVQELAFSEADGTMTFRASAPVLGMGEGAKQFDRRGALYSFKDGWGAWDLPVYGSWVAVPFLIGTDGWALFVHQPRGQFDLRGRDGSFTPAAEQKGLPRERGDEYLWGRDLLVAPVVSGSSAPLPPPRAPRRPGVPGSEQTASGRRLLSGRRAKGRGSGQ
jgi:hypothetical protein